MKLKKKFYCCNVAAEWELFETATTLYPSVAKLKKARTCWKYCGIAEITMTGKAITKGRKEKFK
jgi:hypothetical protein